MYFFFFFETKYRSKEDRKLVYPLLLTKSKKKSGRIVALPTLQPSGTKPDIKEATRFLASDQHDGTDFTRSLACDG